MEHVVYELLVPGYLRYKVFFLDTKDSKENTITKQVPVEFVTVEGNSHFDIDTEYMEDILEFFNQ